MTETLNPFEEIISADEHELAQIAFRHLHSASRAVEQRNIVVIIAALGWTVALTFGIWWFVEGVKVCQ